MVTLPVILDSLSQVAGRSVEASIDFIKNQALIKRDDSPPTPPNVPVWGAILMIATVVFFIGAILSYQYTIGDLIGTLTMIESPTAEIVDIAPPAYDDEPDNTLDKEQKEGLLEAAPVVALVPAKPITSKLRTTMKHLKANAGRLSRWRGIVPAMLYSFFVACFYSLLEGVVPGQIPGRSILLKTVSALAFARLHMAWTHAMISMPSELSWYQRLAPLSSYKQLWLPTVVANVALHVSIYLMFGFVALFVLFVGPAVAGTAQSNPTLPMVVTLLGAIGVVAVSIFVSLAIMLPAQATLIRVEASMLPEDQETIVPFDRSFGGKVVPKVLGGTGSIGFVDAWKTFTWEARRRLVKVYVKNFFIQFTLTLALFQVVALELYFIMGNDIQRYARQYHDWAIQHQQQI